MKITHGLAAVAMAALGSVYFASGANAGPDNSRPDDAGKRCSKGSLKGAFGVKFEGVKLPNKHFNSVAVIKFDGNGTFRSSETGRFEGAPITRTFTGPYVVNADCSGYLDFSSNITTPPHEAHGAFVIVDEGKGLFFLDDEDDWAAGGVGRKM